MAYGDTSPKVEISTKTAVSDAEAYTFDELYLQFSEPLLRMAKFRYGARDPANAVQDVFMKAFDNFYRNENGEIITDKATLRQGWLFTVLRNSIFNEGRAKVRRNQVLASDMREYAEYPDRTANDGYEDVELNDNFDLVMQRAKEILCPEHQNWYDMFVLRAVYEKTNDEISEELNIEPATVRSGLFRTRKLLSTDVIVRGLLDKSDPTTDL